MQILFRDQIMHAKIAHQRGLVGDKKKGIERMSYKTDKYDAYILYYKYDINSIKCQQERHA